MAEGTQSGRTYRNPVHDRPFADPFVLKFNGAYYAYGTPAGGALPVLRSTDLVSWQPAGEVLAAPEQGLAHWAPEVAHDNGRFLLYYSTGGREGEHHQLRIGAGTSPLGPFDDDQGLLDPDDPFTIDAHPFRDDDGQWYLFYSRDFLEGDHVGTGIVVDRLVDMTALAGERATVLRPHADWHLYQRQRRWYDRVWDWYTVEGPFVRKHEGRYWCFYSGGAWKAENYGISSAVADHPMGPYEPVVSADTADVLRTVPGKVIGPGHGSAVVAPDNVTEYLVYHAWDVDHTGRFLSVDPLLWDEGRPQSRGPSSTPQPSPPEPLFRDLVGGPSSSGRADAGAWRLQQGWRINACELHHPGGATPATAVLDLPSPRSFLFEVSMTMGPDGLPRGRCGVIASYEDEDNYVAVFLDPRRGELAWHAVRAGAVGAGGSIGRLRDDFAPGAWHQFLLRCCGGRLTVTLDGVAMGPVPADGPPRARVGIWTSGAAVTAVGVTLTALR